jgi:hypothetical protein
MPEKCGFPSEKEVWLGAESNRRHVDFQSTALPTELPSREIDNRTPGVHYAKFARLSNNEASILFCCLY